MSFNINVFPVALACDNASAEKYRRVTGTAPSRIPRNLHVLHLTQGQKMALKNLYDNNPLIQQHNEN